MTCDFLSQAAGACKGRSPLRFAAARRNDLRGQAGRGDERNGALMERDFWPRVLLGCALLGLLGGLALRVTGQPEVAHWVWVAGVLPALLGLVVEILRSLARGEVGLDIVAALSMTASLAFGESLAAAVVGVMYAGGTFLENFAEGRARREMSDLLSRVPRTALRQADGRLEEVPIEKVLPGDRLVIRQGDVAPVDGVLIEPALLDLSALTGESLPVRLAPGEAVMSGATNAGAATTMTATRIAAESTYAGIVRLVEAAQKSKAPMSRMADRFSLVFLGVTLIIAGLAWGLTGDPIRGVAVLVIATPCPLILAVPVALVAGLSRAARYGVLVKGAQALETLAGVRSLVLDKTGTLTEGRAQLVSVTAEDGLDPSEVLRLAAALDQASRHPMALALVAEARERGLDLPIPDQATEVPGEGLTGVVEGRSVAVGGEHFIARITGKDPDDGHAPGSVVVGLAVEGRLAGRIVLADPLRDGAGEMIGALRELGVERILLATGDRPDVAARVTRGLGLTEVHAGLSPEEKVALVLAERDRDRVMMVGDGVNDAPALAAADIGVAMGARGAAASAEAADIVLLVDRLDRILPGIEIARAARAIALQSVVAGIGLSVIGMIAAAFGLIPPVGGALVQEAIDVAVILNALRALRVTPRWA